MAKQTGRDYPLSPTPDPSSDSSMSRKDYRMALRQAKMKHNIKSAEEGTLNDERMKKVKNVTSVIGDVISSVSGIKNLASRGGGNGGSRGF